MNELVTNAVKHAFPKGQSGAVTVTLRAIREQVQLQVRDNGRGLPPGLDLEHAKTLGLRIIYLLARRLEATVTIERTGGTTISLAFPLHAEEPAEPK